MTIIKIVKRIYDEHMQDLRTQKEKDFIYDMYEGLLGLGLETQDCELDDYITPRQIQWIKDIGEYLGIRGG